MPIIKVEIVEDPSKAGIAVSSRELADALGSALGSGPGGTWVKMCTFAASQYAENDTAVPPRPVFVSVLKADSGSQEDRRKEARILAGTIARVVGRPIENVHILYESDARGRIAFGGELRD